jgi:hypothetical protein
MKPYRILFTIVTLALAYLMTSAVMPTSASTPAPPPPIDTRKLIKSVNAADSSIVIEYMRDKTLHPYKIDDITALKVNNVPGKVTDIKAGMVVDDYVERDGQTLDGLNVSGNGGTPTAAKPATKPKPKPKPTTPPQT